MSVPKVICDRKTRDKLGEDGLAEVRSRLYAVDCQTCGRPLGTDVPALVVNDADEWAQADLHHRGCRAAEWNDGTVIGFPGGIRLPGMPCRLFSRSHQRPVRQLALRCWS